MLTHETVSGDYRRLGLVADPFPAPDDTSADSAGIHYATRAASLRLLAAIDAAADDPSHLPIIVEKAPLIPASYFVTALAPALGALSKGVDVPGVLSAYVPLDMMRVGRVRAVLGTIAERVSGITPDLTLGQWAHGALATPDESLAEWSALTETSADLAGLIAEADADPAAFARKVFGEPVQSREGADDYESLMRVAVARQDKLDTDPVEGEEGLAQTEDNSEDALAEAFITPLGEVDPEVLPEAEEDIVPGAVADYVIAYTRANLSPVVARGIQAYRAQGTASMAQELKITKAPTKTVQALLKFTQDRYRAAAIIYDRLEMWGGVPADLRTKIVATLTSLRWALKDRAVLVLILESGTAPELEENFAAARRVSWSFAEIESVWDEAVLFDAEIVAGWLASASLTGEVPAWAPELLNAVPEGTPLDRSCAAISYSLAEAVSAGRDVPDPAAVSAALEMEGLSA